MFLSACRILLRCQKHCTAHIQAFPATVNLAPRVTVVHRSLCSEIDPKDIVKTAAKKERTKTVEIPKITLLDENDKIISVTTMVEAEKLATSKKLRLVQIVDKDTRTIRPVFKLMSEAEYIEEDLKLRKQNKEERKKSSSYIKGEKMMIITSKITQADLDMKLRKIMKWLEKKIEVHILISGNAESQAAQEEMFKKIEKVLKDQSRIVQKIFKSGNLKFHAIPLKPEKDKKGDEENREMDPVSKEKKDVKESEAV